MQRLEDTDGDCLTDGETVYGRSTAVKAGSVFCGFRRRRDSSLEKIKKAPVVHAGMRGPRRRSVPGGAGTAAVSGGVGTRTVPGQPASGDFHDLRTPLSGIMGTSEMIRDMSREDDPRHALAQGIWDDADWLRSLVENILNLTRLEDGRLVLQKTAGGRGGNHRKRAGAYRQTGAGAGNRRGYPGRPAARSHGRQADRAGAGEPAGQCDQAYGTGAGDPHCSTAGRDRRRFLWADRGDGISPEDLPYIFRTFYTSRHNRADAKRGIGLGLAICDAIVKAHGGTIRAENRTDGGALFRFTLPMEVAENA